MTALRSLAVKMSGFVVRHVSAGSREWAEGLAREVEFVEGDWRALGWALGSLRVLVDRREAPLGSLQDVPALAQKLRAAKDARDIWTVPLGVFATHIGIHLVPATVFRERVGYGLVMCGWIVLGVAMYVAQSRRKERLASPAGTWTLLYHGDVRDWALYYKSELEFGLEQQRSPLFWLFIFALLLVVAGLIISFGAFAFSAAFVLSVVLLVIYSRNKTQLQLDRLNTLLADSADADQSFST